MGGIRVGVDNSVVPGGSRVNVLVTVNNDGSQDAVILKMTRISPLGSTGFSDDQALVGSVCPPGKVTQLQFGVILPQAAGTEPVVYPLEYVFGLGQDVVPEENPSVEVLPLPIIDGNAVANGALPGNGSLWLDSNVQSALLAVV